MNVCSNGKYGEKSSLNSSKNRLLQLTHFAKNFFRKRSWIWRTTPYTLNFTERICLYPPVVELGPLKFFHCHSCALYFKNGKSLELPTSIAGGEIEMCVHWVFCRKFDLIQFLFEAFFNIIGTFGSGQFKSEPTFPFQYIIKYLRNSKFLTLHSSTSGGDRDMRPPNFF